MSNAVAPEPAAEPAGGGEAKVKGSRFPLCQGEAVLKQWEQPTPKCVVLSRDRISLVKTDHAVGFSAEKVQPCCPDKILFEASIQHYDPDSISVVHCSKAPYYVPALVYGLLFTFASFGALAGAMGAEEGSDPLPMIIAFLILFGIGGSALAYFFLRAYNAVCEVEIVSSVETYNVWGLFTGAEHVITSVPPAGIGSLSMGASDDVGLQLMFPAGTVETQKGEWKVKPNPKKKEYEMWIVTDKRFVWRKYAKWCCLTTHDDLMTIVPEHIQQATLDTAPVNFVGFYVAVGCMILGLLLIVMGFLVEGEDEGKEGNPLVPMAVALMVFGLFVFLYYYCKRPKDVLTINLKTAVFNPLQGGSQTIGPILLPTGKGQEVLALVRETLRSARIAAGKGAKG